jgi:polyisoprenyl-phosphate glycosyltransferase
MIYSLIIPVYKNKESIPRLIVEIEKMAHSLSDRLEVVFVVDGSPDESYSILKKLLTGADQSLSFAVQLVRHSRNFGSFAAIKTGLTVATGQFFAVMAADLQEPPELILSFFKALSEEDVDVAIGTRIGRDDPLMSRIASGLFWGIYRKFVNADMPTGGVDIFACNKKFKDQLVSFSEARSSLIALVFWLGFNRKFVDYQRLPRQEGRSAWTLGKKIEYMKDSIFAFTDFPVRMLTLVGAWGSLLSIGTGLFILFSKISGLIDVSGFSALALFVLTLGALNLFGLGLIGTYAWRAYENTKNRPFAIVATRENL